MQSIYADEMLTCHCRYRGKIIDTCKRATLHKILFQTDTVCLTVHTSVLLWKVCFACHWVRRRASSQATLTALLI